VEGVTDCTLHDWLMRCLIPERNLNAGAADAIVFATNKTTSVLASQDDIKLHSESLYPDGNFGDRSMHEEEDSGDAAPRGVSLSGSMRMGSKSTTSRFLELPAPRSTAEILYFQHGRSRIGLISRILLELSSSEENHPQTAISGSKSAGDFGYIGYSGHHRVLVSATPVAEKSASLQESTWNTSSWHKLIQHLSQLQSFLGDRLHAAKQQITDSERTPGTNTKKDPVLIALVQREMLDALHEDPLRETLEPSLQDVQTELLVLQKLLKQPTEEQKGLGFPLTNAFSAMATSAKETIKAFGRLWPPEVDSSEALALATSPGARSRTRSSSASGRTPRRHQIFYSVNEHESACRRRCSWNVPAPESLSPESTIAVTVSSRCRFASDDCLVTRPKTSQLPDPLTEKVNDVVDMLSEVTKEGQSGIEELDPCVHNLCLPVHHEDVGSIIAHVLLSCQYHEQMTAQWALVNSGCPRCPLACHHGSEWNCFASWPASLGCLASSCTSTEVSPASCSSATTPVPVLTPALSREASPLSNKEEFAWKRLPGHVFGSGNRFLLTRAPWEDDWERRGVRTVLTAATSEQPIRVEYSDKEARYSVTVHHAAQYHILRHWLCGDDLNFVRSLHRCRKVTPTGGKSHAGFLQTHDGRFLLKTINGAEYKMLTTRNHAQAMFAYVDQILFEKLPSVLAQVMGLFMVSCKTHKKAGGSKRYYIVQRNIRFSLPKPHPTFDLKGVGKNRRVPSEMPQPAQGPEQANDGEIGTQSGQQPEAIATRPAAGVVLWDQNFREWTGGKPLCLGSQDLKYLEAAVHNDTLFLSSQTLIDYSLLLAAVQPDIRGSETAGRGKLALGIIDWLHPFTKEKYLESTVKSVMHSDRPTVIEPKSYARRFLDAMGTFFVSVGNAVPL